MSEYVSVKNTVLKELEAHLSEMQERFGIESLYLFGSVARGEDTIDSDIDILYTFKEGASTLANLIELDEYLEELLGRKIDLVGRNWISPYIRSDVIAGAIAI